MWVYLVIRVLERMGSWGWHAHTSKLELKHCSRNWEPRSMHASRNSGFTIQCYGTLIIPLHCCFFSTGQCQYTISKSNTPQTKSVPYKFFMQVSDYFCSTYSNFLSNDIKSPRKPQSQIQCMTHTHTALLILITMATVCPTSFPNNTIMSWHHQMNNLGNLLL